MRRPTCWRFTHDSYGGIIQMFMGVGAFCLAVGRVEP
jgi:hypothetical protein